MGDRPHSTGRWLEKSLGPALSLGIPRRSNRKASGAEVDVGRRMSELRVSWVNYYLHVSQQSCAHRVTNQRQTQNGGGRRDGSVWKVPFLYTQHLGSIFRT